MRQKRRLFVPGEGDTEIQHKRLIASSDGFCTNDNGFSSITPINPSDRRMVARANFEANGFINSSKGGPPEDEAVQFDTVKQKQSQDVNSVGQHTQKTTTMRSRAASSVRSRKTTSFKSLRSRQRQSRASDR